MAYYRRRGMRRTYRAGPRSYRPRIRRRTYGPSRYRGRSGQSRRYRPAPRRFFYGGRYF